MRLRFKRPIMLLLTTWCVGACVELAPSDLDRVGSEVQTSARAGESDSELRSNATALTADPNATESPLSADGTEAYQCTTRPEDTMRHEPFAEMPIDAARWRAADGPSLAALSPERALTRGTARRPARRAGEPIPENTETIDAILSAVERDDLEEAERLSRSAQEGER